MFSWKVESLFVISGLALNGERVMEGRKRKSGSFFFRTVGF